MRTGSGRCIPKYKGGRPPEFTLAQRQEIKNIAKTRLARQSAEYDLPFSTWSLSKLAEFL